MDNSKKNITVRNLDALFESALLFPSLVPGLQDTAKAWKNLSHKEKVERAKNAREGDLNVQSD
jgi:hypothetical protein